MEAVIRKGRADLGKHSPEEQGRAGSWENYSPFFLLDDYRVKVNGSAGLASSIFLEM